MMKNLTLAAIVSACNGKYFGPDEHLEKEVSGIAIDSRKIEEGWLFAATVGERVDGHSFIESCYEKGALCCLGEKDCAKDGRSYIQVTSTFQALKDIAEYYRSTLEIPVVGITGSVGKTSTKEMISSVLGVKFNTLKTAGNFNNEVGLPLTVFNIRETHEAAVLEMGISDFGEMSRLAKMAQPDICVITNIGLCHLENLIDRDGVLKAKTEMFEYRQPNAKIVLNGDDDKLITVKNSEDKSPLYFGLSTDMDAYADNIHSLSLKGTSCTLHLGDNAIDVIIPIPGHHMVYNALAGALVGRELGLTSEEIKAGIEALVPVSGRNNMISTDSLLIIDDCYNANPVSMKASVDVLATADTRKVAILGDMFELGENENELHRGVGVHAAEKEIDVLVCIGALSKNIAEGAANSKTAVHHFETKADFLNVIETLIKKDDCILVKASHGMEFPEIVEKLQTISF